MKGKKERSRGGREGRGKGEKQGRKEKRKGGGKARVKNVTILNAARGRERQHLLFFATVTNNEGLKNV